MKSPTIDLTKNIVALQKGLVCIPDSVADNRIHGATLQANLLGLGYMMDQDCLERVSSADLSWISEFHNETIPYLHKMLGGGKKYEPLYKNFPEEVVSLSTQEILFTQMLHYISHGKWSPESIEMERPIAFEKITPIILKSCTEAEFDQIFTDLIGINTSLTPQDQDVILWFCTTGRSLKFPERIPFKENLCVLASLGLDVPIKTTTDVLRIAVYMSGGDPALPALPPKFMRIRYKSKTSIPNPERLKFRFKKFKRSERIKILSLLEKTNCDPAEMVLKDQRWIRLGEILHPGEYKERFPKAFAAFDAIRNTKVKSWYGHVDAEFKRGIEPGLFALAQRGGEFVRRMDYLVRSNPKETQKVLDSFLQAIKTCSNKVLYEAYGHFETRRNPVKNRSVMIKGARRKTALPDLPAIPSDIVESVHSIIFSELKERFSKLPPLGATWIDPLLQKLPLPTNMRSLNFSMRPTIRGQRVPFANPDAKVIRAFVHWTDERGNIDLDLSAIYSGEGESPNVVVQNFSSPKMGSNIHSGDVRYRRGNCAEYIDVLIKETLKAHRYVVLDVRSFTGAPLSESKACFGFMEREFPEANSNWLPETIANTLILQSEAVNTVAVILDLKTREYIFLDIDGEGIVAGREGIPELIEEWSKPPKISVYDLLFMHVEARGQMVTLEHHVDTYLKAEDFTKSYQEIAKWMGI
jgi:hypothetical protein